jgi:hypothetical protein
MERRIKIRLQNACAKRTLVAQDLIRPWRDLLSKLRFDSSLPVEIHRHESPEPRILMHRSPWLLLAACLLLGSETEAKELKDETFGFRCVVPDEFESITPPGDYPRIIFFLMDQKPGGEKPPISISIMRMTTSGEAGYHLKVSDIPPREGAHCSVDEFQWKGLTMSAVRMELMLPSKDQGVTYGAIYPLDKAAVALHVVGPKEREAEIQKLFYEVAAGFENLRPLPPEILRIKAGLVPVKRVQYTLYDQMRMFFGDVPPLVFVGAGVLLVIAVSSVVMLTRRYHYTSV